MLIVPHGRAATAWRLQAHLAGVVLLASLAAGCQSPKPEMQQIEASKSVIHFEHAGFDPDRTTYYLRREPSTGNAVYVLISSGPTSRAVLAALKTGSSYVVEERSTESYVGGLLDKKEPDWGDRGRTVSRLGPVSYRLFRLSGPAAGCVGFSQLVGEAYGQVRYGNDALFGYLCQDGTGPMSPPTAEELISSLSLTRVP